MKLCHFFLFIGVLLLIAHHTTATLLTNDFFSRNGGQSSFVFPQGFPSFGGFNFFNPQPQPQLQTISQQPAAQKNPQSQIPVQKPASLQQTQEPLKNRQQNLTPQVNSSLLSKNQQDKRNSQQSQINSLPQQNQQQSQQTQQLNGQVPQNQQFFPQQNQQYIPPNGQPVNQNQQQFFPNQNQGGFNQNQGGLNGNQNQNVAQNLLTPINQQGGLPNNQNTQQNLLNPVVPDHRRGLADCEEEFKNEVLIFDNNRQELCKAPRQWNGAKCVCPGNGVFLSGKCFSEVPRERTRNIFSLRFINRNYDGSENNPKYPEYGARGNPLLRLTEPNYEDGRSEPLKRVPNPRDVSNAVGDIKDKLRFLNMFNQIFITWSEFIGNDITFTPTQANETFNIQIPRCDKIFDKFCTGKQDLSFTRSIYQIKRRIRTNINTVSSWLDASNIYGSDQKTADSLREFKGGRMKVGPSDFLPKNENGEFISGDKRVNQNVLLTILHTIFIRQHNRLCEDITEANSALTDQEVYQIARNYVIGLVQHITFDEWLPMLFGRQTFNKYIGNYTFDPEANPAIFSEFQVGALRVFDTYLRPTISRFHPDQATQVETVKYSDVVLNTQLLNQTTFSEYLSGSIRGMIKTKTVELVDDLRHNWITAEFPNQDTDLYSLNLQRCRDHGVGSLKDIRDALGLSPKNISLAFVNQNNLDCLEALYQNPDNVELWLALIGEEPEPMTALGEIGNRLWILQMNKIRNGDSLWYENVYPEEVVKEIKATSLRNLFERHGGVRFLPMNPFMMMMNMAGRD